MRYRIRKNLLAFPDDHYIVNELNEPVFFADGKMTRLRGRLAFLDLEGNEQAYIRERLAALHSGAHIYSRQLVVATIRRQAEPHRRHQFSFELTNGPTFVTTGRPQRYAYSLQQNGRTAAHITATANKDTGFYFVTITQPDNHLLLIIGTVIIDALCRIPAPP